MCGFKIICENNLWRFEIIPSNNRKQAMGSSVEYTSRAECEQAVHAFKKLVKENLINSADSSFVKIEGEKKAYAYKYFDEANNLLFTSRFITKANCNKAIMSIYNNYIDKPILQD